MEDTIINFKQDTRPQDEVMIWEFINLCFQIYMNETGDIDNKKDIINQLLLISVGNFNRINGLSENTHIKLLEIWKDNILLFFNSQTKNQHITNG